MLENEPDRVETNAPGQPKPVDAQLGADAPSEVESADSGAPRRSRRKATKTTTKATKATTRSKRSAAGDTVPGDGATSTDAAAGAGVAAGVAAAGGADASGDAAAGTATTEPASAAADTKPARRRRKVVTSDAGGESGGSAVDGAPAAENPAASAAADAGERRTTRTRRRSTKAAQAETGAVDAGAADAGESAADREAAAAGDSAAGEPPTAKAAPAKAGKSGRTARTGKSGRAAKSASAPVTASDTDDAAGSTDASGSADANAAATDAVDPNAAEQRATEKGATEKRATEKRTTEKSGTEKSGTERGRRRRPILAVPVFMAPVEQEPAAANGQPAAADEAPVEDVAPTRRRRGRRSAEAAAAEAATPSEPAPEITDADEATAEDAQPVVADDEDSDDATGRRRRRRGRRGRGRGRGSGADEGDEDVAEDAEIDPADESLAASGDQAGSDGEDGGAGDGESMTRRRRRRRRKGAADSDADADTPNVVVRIREPRKAKDEVQSVSGSTRLEAKRQRRRDGREQRRTRPAILSESEFLARREAVDRVMVVRQRNDRTQIAVLEDGVLVEHYVARASAATMVGNVYLGRVQNVLPSMEAAFVDLGRGRNAVLYAGEVNWEATGLEGRTRTIEQALRSGDSVLVQVTKDPIGTKGARLTSHIALSGRHLVFVPNGNASGISRKLSDVERKRLRDILKNLVPDGSGVIVRTAAEGASEDDLARDVKRLEAQWGDIQRRATSGNAPALLYEEPDLVIRVVRDLFNEDFRELVVQGTSEYEMIESYLGHVSPDLVQRLRRYTGTGDVFADLRIDEQIIKGLDRKVYLPSGGSLVIDRTEAMTVIDVNTGKYTGAGGNLEETVTRNNLEAAEEIVRQLRLRDLGGIIVIDFIDMVLESNRELVLRRLTECLGRDRTKHQVTEITSLGLVQMTRKRAGQGLLEAFSETCEVCKGRGLIIHTEPVPDRRGGGDRSGVAKIAAATIPPTANGSGAENAAEPAGGGNGNGASGGESSRSGRRRGRRAAAGNAAEAEPSGGTPTPPAEVPESETSEAPGTAEPDPGDDAGAQPARQQANGYADAADDEGSDDAADDLAAVGGRRRTRRGGTRRRTRP